MIGEIVIFVLCLLLSCLFSGSESAVVSIPVDRLKILQKEKPKYKTLYAFLILKPNVVLTTILVGNNLVNILAASVITVLAQKIFGNDAVAYATGFTTVLILIFGEVMPKSFARAHAEKLAPFILRFLKIVYFILFPAVYLTTFFVEKVIGKYIKLKERRISSNDLEYLIERAEKHSSIDSKQLNFLSSIMEFPGIKVKDIMVPRKEVIYIQKDMGFKEVIHLVRKHGHSRYPVTVTDLDDVMGFLHVKDLAFVRTAEIESFKVLKYLKAPFFVYEHMKVHAVFEHMKRSKVHLALVKDENALVKGIITLEDIIEEILGEIHDEHDDEPAVAGELGDSIDGSLLLDGHVSLRDLDNDYGIYIPLNDNFSTLSGFILDKLGNTFPAQGQMIFWEGYSFTLETVRDFEIYEVRIKKVDGSHIYGTSTNTRKDNSNRDDG